MNARGWVSMALSGLVMLSTGCRRAAAPSAPLPDRQSYDITAEALRWADSVASGMTLEERVGQLFLPAVFASASESDITALRRYCADMHVGGLILLRGDARSAAAVADTMRALSRVIPFMAIDAEWGLAMRIADAPEFPANSSLSKADESLMYDYGYEMGREMRALGLNIMLGPVVDVASQKRGIMGRRSFGPDPGQVAALGVAYSKGAEAAGIISVAKHFPGHGSPSADSHRELARVERSRQELDSIDLLPFRAYIDAGLSGVMVGHLAVPALDSIVRPAAVSPSVISGLLRRDMGFRGLVFTDALNMGGAAGHGSVEAFRAGADIVLAPEDTGGEIARVCTAVRDGELPLSVIDMALRRVLFYKYILEMRGSGVAVSGDINLNDSLAAGLHRRLNAVASSQP